MVSHRSVSQKALVQPVTSEIGLDDEKRSYGHADSVERDLQSTEVDERRLLRKIDLHLVPALCILYLLAFLDRCVLS